MFFLTDLARKMIPGWARRRVSPRNPIRALWVAALSLHGAVISRFPARGMTVIAVTGTDGKTTTTAMIGHLLEKIGAQKGWKIAVATTAFSRIAGKNLEKRDKLTTLSPAEMADFLQKCRRAGVTHLVLEASSVALFQRRLAGIPVAVGVFLNLTPEELRFHGSMDHYRASKKLLLAKARRAVVLPAGDDFFGKWSEEFSAAGKKVFGFSPDEKSVPFWPRGVRRVVAEKVRAAGSGGQKFAAAGADFSLPLPEKFNLENALAAIAAVRALGVETAEIAPALETFPGVSGRGERVDLPGAEFAARVDYAQTPAAFRALLESLRAVGRGRVLIVFGLPGGGRDREKRPVVGRIAAELADRVFLTEDEPYDEDPARIAEEILAGVPADLREKITVVPDRRAAIWAALGAARAGDLLTVNGMGAEISRNSGGREIPWREAEVVAEEWEKVCGGRG